MGRTDELYATDQYLRVFEGAVVDVDETAGRVALDRTAFYPGGGGQPADRGELVWHGGRAAVAKVQRDGGLVWHWLAPVDDPGERAGQAAGEAAGGWQGLPDPGAEVQGTLDWERRHLLMRTHTALHILCGVIWADFRVAVTGGNMEPGSGRLDFALDAMSSELGARMERRINEEIQRARDVLVDFVDRTEADRDPALIRTQANLIPASIDPLRVIDIVGLDKQADGGTHVATTAEVGRVEITRTESKGKANKRIRLALHDA